MPKKHGAAKKHQSDAAAQIAESEATIAAQQETIAKATGAGYVGVMSADERAKVEEEMHVRLNTPEDVGVVHSGVRPAVIGRDPNADLSDMDEGDSIEVPGSRVGFATVEHPRARMARALHDRLKGSAPSSFTFDELEGHAGKVGMVVDATADSGVLHKADLVRAMDELLAQHPAPATP